MTTLAGPNLILFLCVISSCSTTENLTIFVWEQLLQALGEKSPLLHEVRIQETENNTFVYRGESYLLRGGGLLHCLETIVLEK